MDLALSTNVFLLCFVGLIPTVETFLPLHFYCRKPKWLTGFDLAGAKSGE